MVLNCSQTFNTVVLRPINFTQLTLGTCACLWLNCSLFICYYPYCMGTCSVVMETDMFLKFIFGDLV